MSNSYRSIAKANALFGGVQIYNILVGIIRSKIVAVILGPEGMGIMGLFNSTLDLIKSATNMGLQVSAVREIALASKDNDINKISQVSHVLSHLIWITGIFGVSVTFFFAPYLSEFAFDNRNYTLHFRILSVVLLISQQTVYYNVILQGMRKLRLLAQANIIGSTVGLCVIMPLYYFWGYNAIMPGIIITAAISYIVARYSAKGIKFETLSMQFKEVLCKGRQMLTMGFLLSLTGLMDMIVAYLVKIAITHWGSVVDVGLYTAGYSMVLGYVGLVFSSIGTDYFPRLSVVSNDKEQYNNVINQQFELLILVLTPLILIFIAFSPLLLHILYSSKFVSVSIMINWLTAGMIFRAIAWCPGFMYIARNDTKLYLFIYVIAIAVELSLFIGFYYFMGLDGLGISFFIMNFLSAIFTIVITRWRYGCAFGKNSYKFMIYSIFAIGVTLAASYLSHSAKYLVFSAIIIPFLIISFKELDKRLDVRKIIRKRFYK